MQNATMKHRDTSSNPSEAGKIGINRRLQTIATNALLLTVSNIRRRARGSAGQSQRGAKVRRLSMLRSAALLLWSSASWAQVDFGMSGLLESRPVEIYQHGQRVGLAWVQPSGSACQYTEYWYLSARYVYPNSPAEGETIETVIRAMQGDGPAFDTPRAFFQYARATMPAGKHILAPQYVMEDCSPNHDG